MCKCYRWRQSSPGSDRRQFATGASCLEGSRGDLQYVKIVARRSAVLLRMPIVKAQANQFEATFHLQTTMSERVDIFKSLAGSRAGIE
jgi:hypothetical protein